MSKKPTVQELNRRIELIETGADRDVAAALKVVGDVSRSAIDQTHITVRNNLTPALERLTNAVEAHTEAFTRAANRELGIALIVYATIIYLIWSMTMGGK